MDDSWGKLSQLPPVVPDLNFGPSKEYLRELKEAGDRAQEIRQAQLDTAKNTGTMREQLDRVICNQNDYIDYLKNQNNELIRVLENIFASSEDSAAVQKEIMGIMQEKNISEELIKDKGMDMFIQGLFTCISIYLSSKGIKF